MPSFQIITPGRMTPRRRDDTACYRDSIAYTCEAAMIACARIDRALRGDLAPVPFPGDRAHRADSTQRRAETFERYHPGARIVGVH